ncbi:heavy metal-binding domain-containing protein [Pelosinus sp. IPA-1]|nr:heavy metal-binding domain-containing protein [Pelosinus sp. IPA-1]
MSKMTKTIVIQDMHCASCEAQIEKMLRQLNGVTKVKACYARNTVSVEYETTHCHWDEISNVIINQGYRIESEIGSATKIKSIIGMLSIFLAILMLGQFTSGFDMNSKLRGEVTYFILFMIGVFTSLHCVGMCGGIMMSQTIITGEKSVTFLPSFSYNSGRLVGYTVLGGVFGAVGSMISISIGFMSGVAIFAGICMILMGINMSGIAILRGYITIPWSAYSPALKSRTPFVVGILNGLMPCGPLQTMQLYALGTGSALDGAIAMFIFAIGTLPLMLSFGVVTGMMSKNLTKKIMKCSGAFVIILGIIMANRGLAIAGFQMPFSNFVAQTNNGISMATKAEINTGVQTIRIIANNQGYVPNVLYVQKNMPVRWIITGEQINSCNNQIIIPSLNIKKKLTTGENIIEFTPQGEELKFSCWMGMISGIIKVVDDINAVDISKEIVSIPSGSGCCSTDGTSQCCSSAKDQVSIYGDDIEKVPTERLVHKAIVSGDKQIVNIIGTGYELEPLISVVKKGKDTSIKFNFTAFDKPEGNWELVDYSEKKVIYAFDGRKEGNIIELYTKSLGTLGIYKDKKVVGIIEVVEDLKDIDKEKIRAKFLN